MISDNKAPAWYAARLLFGSRIDGVTYDNPLIEERIVLFFAASPIEAQAAAEAYARSEMHEYANEAGEIVEWYLREIPDLALVGTLPNENEPWEILSRFLRESEIPRPSEESGGMH